MEAEGVLGGSQPWRALRIISSMGYVMTCLGLGVPVSLDLGVEFDEEVGTCLGPQLAERGLVKEEVDAEILMADRGLVGNCKTTDT